MYFTLQQLWATISETKKGKPILITADQQNTISQMGQETERKEQKEEKTNLYSVLINE